MSASHFQVLSPVDGSIWVERAWATAAEAEAVLARADGARAGWRSTPLAERVALLSKMVDAFAAASDTHTQELAWQMGRPVRFGAGEVGGFVDRARFMLGAAEGALADVVPAPKPGFERYIRRAPLGTVLVLSPWNYPYLTAVNAVIPALAAGNTVVLKHSDQTPLCAERMVEAAQQAGLPSGVFQYVHASHELVAGMVRDSRVHHVCFTGSVGGGAAIERAAAGRFLGVNLELGGNDAAYVRPDADIGFAAENVVEGALFNSGQSCCGVERVFVHDAVYDAFIDAAVAAAHAWVLGDPTNPTTTLGPVVRASNAAAIQTQVQAAVAGGARPLLDPGRFPIAGRGPTYLAPQLLDHCTADMALMREETFGPVAAIQRVGSDAEAIAHINDCRFGLTASVWTADLTAAAALGDQLDVGTVFANRCDYLDPALAWTGVKESGRGASLSVLGFHALTRPKSFHLRAR